VVDEFSLLEAHGVVHVEGEVGVSNCSEHDFEVVLELDFGDCLDSLVGELDSVGEEEEVGFIEGVKG